MTQEKGYPHFFYVACIRLNGEPTAPRRIPCTCNIGKNHWVPNPISKQEGVIS